MDRESPSRAGVPFDCPRCGRESVTKLLRRLEGWQCVGEELVCALCQEPLAPPDTRATAETEDETLSEHSAGLHRLADLLGGVAVPEKPRLTAEDVVFCRDCRHFLRHPFVTRCLLHERPVEPMADCAEFERCARDDAASPADDEQVIEE